MLKQKTTNLQLNLRAKEMSERAKVKIIIIKAISEYVDMDMTQSMALLSRNIVLLFPTAYTPLVYLHICCYSLF